jgi:hypothetical protein
VAVWSAYARSASITPSSLLPRFLPNIDHVTLSSNAARSTSLLRCVRFHSSFYANTLLKAEAFPDNPLEADSKDLFSTQEEALDVLLCSGMASTNPGTQLIR